MRGFIRRYRKPACRLRREVGVRYMNRGIFFRISVFRQMSKGYMTEKILCGNFYCLYNNILLSKREAKKSVIDKKLSITDFCFIVHNS